MIQMFIFSVWVDYFPNTASVLPWFRACSVKSLGVDVAIGSIINIYSFGVKVAVGSPMTPRLELNEFDSWGTPALSTRGTTASKLSRSFPSPSISSPANRLLVPCWDFVTLENGHSIEASDLFQFHESIDFFANQCPSSSPTILSFCLAIGGVYPVFSVIARLPAHF